MQKHIMYSLGATVLWGVWAVLVKISSTRMGHWPSVLIYTVFSLASVSILFISQGQNLKQVDLTGLLIAGTLIVNSMLIIAITHNNSIKVKKTVHSSIKRFKTV